MARATTKTTTARKTTTTAKRTTPARKVTAPKSPAAKATAASATKPASAAAKAPAAKAAPVTGATPPKPAAAQGVTAGTATKTATSAQDAGSATVEQSLRKKELIERVASLSGLKKSQAKTAIEATLAILGESLDKGERMDLEPFGKLKIQKERDVGAANVFTCRVRRKKGEAAPIAPTLAAVAQ